MILGCTHYSLINHLFSDLLPGVKLVDPALHTATELKSILTSRNLLSNNSTAAKYSFYATNLKQQSDSVTRRVFAEHPLKQRVEWQHASL
jgi:glutamate racemase